MTGWSEGKLRREGAERERWMDGGKKGSKGEVVDGRQMERGKESRGGGSHLLWLKVGLALTFIPNESVSKYEVALLLAACTSMFMWVCVHCEPLVRCVCVNVIVFVSRYERVLVWRVHCLTHIQRHACIWSARVWRITPWKLYACAPTSLQWRSKSKEGAGFFDTFMFCLLKSFTVLPARSKKTYFSFD